MRRVVFLAVACAFWAGCRAPSANFVAAKVMTGVHEGTWMGRFAGNPGVMTMLVQGDRFVLTHSDGSWLRGAYRMNPQAGPFAADYTIDGCSCDFSGRTFEGLAIPAGPDELLLVGRTDGTRPAGPDEPRALVLRLRRAP